MKILTLSDIISQTIESIRYRYKYQNEYDLQEFYSYIKLSSGIIIDIPTWDDEEFRELSIDNVNYYKESFEKGEEIIPSAREVIYGQRIEDIYFCYFDNEIDLDNPSFLKLSNGYYLTERNIGPPGIPGIDLLYFNQKQFEERIQSFRLTVKSYINEIKNAC